VSPARKVFAGLFSSVDRLELVSAQPTSSGTVIVSYRRAAEA